MIKLNQFDSNNVDTVSYCNKVWTMLKNNPSIMGGIFSPIIQDTEKLLSTFFNRNVVMTSSGTSALLLSIEYALKLSDKPKKIYVSEFLYFSLVSYFLDKDITILKSQIDETNLIYPEFDSDFFNIFVLTSHHNTRVNLDKIVDNLPKSSRFIIEDSCLVFDDKLTNSDISCYSFANNKLLNCGEGGCVSSNDTSFIEWAKYRTYSGIIPTTTNGHFMYLGKYDINPNPSPFKCSINSLSCSLIQEQLNNLPMIIERRKYNYNLLDKDLAFGSFKFQLPYYPLFYDMVLPYPFNMRELNYLILSLLNMDIQTHIGVLPFTFFKTKRVNKNVISLPIHGMLTEEDIQSIVKHTKKIIHDIKKRSSK